MYKSYIKHLSKLGPSDVETRVAQAIASVTLDGLKPSKFCIDLIRLISSGEISGNEALKRLKNHHSH